MDIFCKCTISCTDAIIYLTKTVNLFQEQEARTALLRGRATRKQLQDRISHDKAIVAVDNKPQHLNLFADIEEKVCGTRHG